MKTLTEKFGKRHFEFSCNNSEDFFNKATTFFYQKSKDIEDNG